MSNAAAVTRPHRCQRSNVVGRDHGQAAVEFAIVFPLVMIAVLAIGQIALIVRDQLAVEAVARNAARAASVTSDNSHAVDAGLASTAVDGIEVTIASDGETVTATASRPIKQLPIIGLAVAGRRVAARSTMLVEPPP